MDKKDTKITDMQDKKLTSREVRANNIYGILFYSDC